MAKQPNAYKKFVATAATATLVATALAPVASAAPVDSYKDVSKDYKDAVNYLLENGIAQGTSDTTFGTSNNISRGDAAVMIANALKLDTANAKDQGFQDVNSRVEGAVNAIVEAGIASGRTTAKFDPAAYITRQEMAKMLANAYKLTATEKAGFKDVNKNWIDYVSALKENGITLGKSETIFAPEQNLTRGEFALFVFRAENPDADLAIVDAVSVVNETTTTATLKVANKELTAKDFTVLVNGKEVTPTKVESDAKGEVYTITHASLKDTSGTVSVNGKQAAFNFVVVEPKVESVKAINGKQVQVNFNTAVKESSVISNVSAGTLVANTVTVGRTVQATGADTDKNVTTVTGSLSKDGKTLTLTAAGATYFDGNYSITVSDLVKDTKGEAVKAFSDVVTVDDVTAPTTTGVVFNPTTGNIEVTVSEPLAATPSIFRVNGTPVATAITANADKTKFTFAKPAAVAAGSTASVYVAGAQDYSGNLLAASTTDVVIANDQSALQVVSAEQIDSNKVEFKLNKSVKAPLAASSITALVDGTADAAFTFALDANDTSNKTIVGTYTPGTAAPAYFYGTAASKDVTFVFANDKIVDVFGEKLPTTTKVVKMTKDVTGPKVVSSQVSKDKKYLELTFDEVITNLAAGVSNANVTLRKDGVNVDMTGGNAEVSIAADANGDNKVLKIAADKTTELAAGTYTVRLAAGTVKDAHLNTSDVVNNTVTKSTSATDLTANINGTNATANKLEVTFSEPVSAATALDLNNYKLDGKALPATSDIYFDTIDTTTKVIIDLGEGAANFGTAGTPGKALLSVSGVKSTSGKTVVSTSKTVNVKDNTPAIAKSVQVIGNDIILTFDEAIDITTAAAINDTTKLAANFAITVDGVALNLGTQGTDGTVDGSGATVATALVAGAPEKVKITLTPAVANSSSTDAVASNWNPAKTISVKVNSTRTLTDANSVLVKPNITVTK